MVRGDRSMICAAAWPAVPGRGLRAVAEAEEGGLGMDAWAEVAQEVPFGWAFRVAWFGLRGSGNVTRFVDTLTKNGDFLRVTA